MSTSENADLGQMEIDHTEHCGNADIICLVALIDNGMRQVSRCPSATRNDVQQMDVNIMNGIIDEFEQNFEHFAGKPELYLPNAAPKPKKMPEKPEINIVQNPSLQHQLYELSHMRTQLLFCEDRERMNSFHSVTAENVVRPWITKFRDYNSLIAENVDPENAMRSFKPEANLQEAGVNPGHPR